MHRVLKLKNLPRNTWPGRSISFLPVGLVSPYSVKPSSSRLAWFSLRLMMAICLWLVSTRIPWCLMKDSSPSRRKENSRMPSLTANERKSSPLKAWLLFWPYHRRSPFGCLVEKRTAKPLANCEVPLAMVLRSNSRYPLPLNIAEVSSATICWQLSPVNPTVQSQVYLFLPDCVVQMPPFSQGSLARQMSTIWSQCLPV